MGTRYFYICFLYICFVVILGTTLNLSAQASPPLVKQKSAKIIEVSHRTPQGIQKKLHGKLLVEALDGSLLLEDDQQILHIIPGETIAQRSALSEVNPLTPKQLGQKTVASLPDGFSFITTRHYLICYNTSLGYARWSAALLERLFTGFHAFWSQAGLEVRQPEQPLVVIIFSNRNDYKRAAEKEVGNASHSIVGYYNQLTNRITTYDITGSDSNDPTTRQSLSTAGNSILRNPQASSLIATLVHEATHQLAFNAGLHVRLSPTPVWLSEGIATYFETPDLTNSRGWQSIGAINEARLELILKQFTPGLISRFIVEDEPFHNPDEALLAYAHAWALVSFLATMRREDFCKYIANSKKKAPLELDSPSERLNEFKNAFHSEPDDLEPAIIQYLNAITRRKRP
ncbi:DUF1570 domain-containing protein [Pirellulales bacterium]|nr:DUF1570 domain-containing protein [Pirellulales bacterium]